MSRWFRHYAGMMADPKFGAVARRTRTSRAEVLFVWGCILESAAENESAAFTWDADLCGELLNCDSERAQLIHDEMERSGLVADGRVSSWERRQFVSDTSTERSRKHRAARRNVAATGCNVAATPSHAAASPPETETETETEDSDHGGSESPPDPQAGDGGDGPPEEPIRVLRKPADVTPEDLRAAIEAWNEMAARHSLPQVQTVHDQRRVKLAGRLVEVGGVTGWITALGMVERSAFLMGRKTGSDFRVKFDWLLSPSNLIKLREGNYDDRQQGRGRPAPKRTWHEELSDHYDARGVERNAFSPPKPGGDDAERPEVPARSNADRGGAPFRRADDFEDAEILAEDVFE